MAGFADSFSPENVQRLMSDPRMVLGLQMMQQSGWQPGNPSGGQRFAQAGLGAMQQIQQASHSQQLQQYRQAQIQQAEQQRAFQMQQAQQKADEQQRQRQALQDPNFQSGLGGIAKTLASLGMPLDDVLKAQSGYQLQQHRDASLAQAQAHFEQSQANRGAGGGQPAPKTFTPRQLIEEPLPDGRVQKHMYDADSGEYKPYGAPFNPHSSRGKAAQAAAVDPLEAIVQHATGGGAPVEGGLGSLPGTGSLQQYAPAPQGADLLMRGGSNPTPSIITGGANPNAVREPMRIPGQAKVATPLTRAEYDQLPSGSQYVDPVSGRVAVKK